MNGKKRDLRESEAGRRFKGWQCIVKVEMKFKHRLRERQMVDMDGLHNGSSELPAP